MLVYIPRQVHLDGSATFRAQAPGEGKKILHSGAEELMKRSFSSSYCHAGKNTEGFVKTVYHLSFVDASKCIEVRWKCKFVLSMKRKIK